MSEIIEQLTPIIEGYTSQIEALTAYANETTGESDTRIGDAVQHLIDGYGGGGSSDLPYGGQNPVLIGTFEETLAAADTSFVPGTTAPSSATTIKSKSATERLSSADFPDILTKDIIVVQRGIVTPTYTEEPTGAHQFGWGYSLVHIFGRQKAAADAEPSTIVSSSVGKSILGYGTSSENYASGQAYGIYYSTSYAPSVSTSGGKTFVNVQHQNLLCRYSSTYMTQNALLAVSDFTTRWKAWVYLVDAMTSVQGLNEQAVDTMVSTGDIPDVM